MLQKIFKNHQIITILWFGLALATIISNVFIRNEFNNYLIFEGVFHHTIDKLSLYGLYPQEYFDKNHYGIFFSCIIAPFAILPDKIGCALWILANAGLLFWAIKQLDLPKKAIITILLIAAHDLYTASAMQQFNTSIIALLLLSYVFIKKQQDHWATLFIVIGTFTKLYGIVGLAFFFFSENKIRFVLSGLFWVTVAFCLPMIYSSFDFVISQYQEWFFTLSQKNNANTGTEGIGLQNLSLLGFLQRTGIFNNNLIVIIFGLILFLIPYLRFSKIKNQNFQLLIVSGASLFLVLFSTGTENSTYIIGYVGVGIWFVVSSLPEKIKNILLIFLILGSLSPTDLFPKFIKWNYIIKYSLRAVPVAILYFTIIYELCFAEFKTEILKNENN